MKTINYKALVAKLTDQVLIEYGLHEPTKYPFEEYLDKREKALKQIKIRINALEMTMEIPS